MARFSAAFLPLLLLLTRGIAAIPLNALHEGHPTVPAGVPVIEPSPVDDLLPLPDATGLPSLSPDNGELDPSSTTCLTTTTTGIEDSTTTSPCTTTTTPSDDEGPSTIHVTVTVVAPPPPAEETQEPIFVTVTVTKDFADEEPTLLPTPTGEFDLIDLDRLDELLEEGVLPPVPGEDDEEDDEDAGIVVSTDTTTTATRTSSSVAATSTTTTTTTTEVLEPAPTQTQTPTQTPPTFVSPDGQTLDGAKLEEYWQDRPAGAEGPAGGVEVEVGCEGCGGVLNGGEDEGVLESEGAAARMGGWTGLLGVGVAVGLWAGW